MKLDGVFLIGSVIIGVLTSLAGYPIYDYNTNTFIPLNLLIVVGAVALWFCAIKAIQR